MSADQAQAEYAVVMQQMVDRIGAANRSLDELIADPENERAWVNCDFIALQVRKLCELLALGSSLAHLRAADAEFNASNWHPKDIIQELAGVNPYPLPLPVKISLNHNGIGQHHIDVISKPVAAHVITGIYGRCGDLLHIPSAKRVLSGKLGAFEIARFQSWLLGWKTLLMSHVLFLPEIENVLLCQWAGVQEEAVNCYFLGGDGQAAFSADGLVDFGLLSI